MRELGLSVIAVVLAVGSGCQTSEPARTSPPSSATNPGGPGAPNVGPPAPNAAPSGGVESRVYDETVQLVDVAMNGRFTIALPANVTTPLEWKLEPDPDPALLGLAERKYTDTPPPGCQGCTGYPGTDAFTFVAKGPGEAALHFAYREIRKGAPPAKEITVRVRIH